MENTSKKEQLEDVKSHRKKNTETHTTLIETRADQGHEERQSWEMFQVV